jgi:hypothetical protein
MVTHRIQTIPFLFFASREPKISWNGRIAANRFRGRRRQTWI